MNYNTTSTLKNQELSEWQCHLTNGLVYIPNKDCHPNWFWRKMHYLMFGFKWVKTK